MMAKHRYLTGVLFDDDESDTIDSSPNGFRSRIPRPLPKKTKNYGNTTALEPKQLNIKKTQEIEKRTLESVKRSLNLLHETEDIAICSVQEFASQGEKLEKTNTRLDEIDSHLKQSQKDINGIKSVFYGFKNIISGKARSPSPCKRHILPHKKESSKIGKSTFYDKNECLTRETRKMAEAPFSSYGVDVQSSAEPPSSQKVDELLEAHLKEMTHQITHLRVFGEDFAKEIDRQNELIDIIDVKIEHADTKIGKQNKDMIKILGK